MKKALLLILVAIGLTFQARAYSVLTHQAVIDSVWESDLRPLLLKRFPASDPAQLQLAYSYAYGGAIIQDMGYYPLSCRFFTWLTHYVRSGDFILILMEEAKDVNEFAFALGAMGHYFADIKGHSLGTNKVVPIIYPKLEQKYGSEVNFDENPIAHKRTEFCFDVLFTAQGMYAPEAYRNAIGFRVSEPLLERAFLRTYGLTLRSLFVSFPVSVGSYRKTVSAVIPEMVNVARQSQKQDLDKAASARPGDTYANGRKVQHQDYEANWGYDYEEPGSFARLLGDAFKFTPKVGPLRMFDIEVPDPESERIFRRSFTETLIAYRQALKQLADGQPITLPNSDFDTGNLIEREVYHITDKSYNKLLSKLSSHHFANVSPELKHDILAFYASRKSGKEDVEDLNSNQIRQLQELKNMPLVAAQSTSRK